MLLRTFKCRTCKLEQAIKDFIKLGYSNTLTQQYHRTCITCRREAASAVAKVKRAEREHIRYMKEKHRRDAVMKSVKVALTLHKDLTKVEMHINGHLAKYTIAPIKVPRIYNAITVDEQIVTLRAIRQQYLTLSRNNRNEINRLNRVLSNSLAPKLKTMDALQRRATMQTYAAEGLRIAIEEYLTTGACHRVDRHYADLLALYGIQN